MIKSDFHLHSIFSDGQYGIETIIKSAIDRGMTNIAITDHMSVFGHFLFTLTKPVRELNYYLKEISRMRKKYENKINIFPGAEISQDFLSLARTPQSEDRLQDNLEFFSIFLIETYILREPVLTALNTRKYLSNQGFSHIPVIFAHPSYTQMEFTTFKMLLNNSIGFELNESKLSDSHADFFVEFVNMLTSEEKNKLMISVGSDAHSVEDVGLLEHVNRVIEQNNLEKYVITFPKVHEYPLV